ncbi:MAG: hypothetical protein Q9178_004395 [Gyalolechia marmorata]
MKPARTSAAPLGLKAPERGLASAQHEERLAYRRALKGYVTYRAHMRRLGSSVTKPTSSNATSVVNSAASGRSTVPGLTPPHVSDPYGSAKGLDDEAAPSTTIPAVSTLTSTTSPTSETREAHGEKFSIRQPRMPGSFAADWDPPSTNGGNCGFVHGGFLQSVTKAEQKPEQLRDRPERKNQEIQATHGKSQQVTVKGKKKGKQAADDDWVIVKDPRDLYVVVDRKTPRQRSA